MLRKKNLDTPAVWGAIPHACFDFAQHKSYFNRPYADNSDQTSEVFETSEVFTPNHNFTRRGAWHAPSVRYRITPVLDHLYQILSA